MHPESLVDEWLRREAFYGQQSYDAPRSRPHILCGGARQGSVVLTAVHAVNTIREGQIKYADRGTGGLVDVLGGRLDFTTVVKATPEAEPAHPTLFDVLSERVTKDAFVLDIHGMRDQRDLDVEIGTGDGDDTVSQAVAERLGFHFRSAGLAVAIDEVYRGARSDSIVSWCRGRNIPGIQVELAARCRPPVGERRRMVQVLQAFLTCADMIEVGLNDVNADVVAQTSSARGGVD